MLFPSFLTIINENKHTCQLNTLEIDKRETNPRFLHWHIICFYLEKKSGTKNKFLTEEYNGKCWHRNYSGHLAQFFNVIIRGTFKSFAMQNTRRLFIFSRGLKPDKQQIVLLLNYIVWAFKVFMNYNKWFNKCAAYITWDRG